MEKLNEILKDLEQRKISVDNAEEKVLRLFNVSGRSEQVCDFVSWARENVKRPAYENLEFWLSEWRHQKSQTCA